MEVLKVKKTLDILNKKLDENKPFAYLRFGDGRILMMDGWQGEESDHFYNAKLKEELIKSIQIQDENYLISIGCGYEEEEGMKPGTFGRFSNNDTLKKIIEKNTKQKEFLNFITLHYYSLYEPKLVIEFINKIKKRKVVVVGGKHLKTVTKYFNAKFIETPTFDAYEKIERIYKSIYRKKSEIVILAAGMCSAVIQKRLFEDGANIITLDFGSLLDGMLNLQTRRWIVENPEKIKEFMKLLKQ